MRLPAASFLLGQLCEMGLLGVDMGMGMAMDAPVVAAQKMLALYIRQPRSRGMTWQPYAQVKQPSHPSYQYWCNRMFVKIFCTHSDCSISVCMYLPYMGVQATSPMHYCNWKEEIKEVYIHT